jgi:hypothetical protein
MFRLRHATSEMAAFHFALLRLRHFPSASEKPMLGSIQHIDLFALSGCLVAVAVFAGYVFPRQLAADGEARLPRRWVSMMLFVGLNMMFFLTLAGVTLVLQNWDEAGDILSRIFDISNHDMRDVFLQGDTLADGLIGGLVAYYAAFAFRKGRMIAAGAMRQLHSVNLIEEDVKELDQRLREGDFARMDAEPDSTSQKLDQLQRRVSDANADNPRTSLSMKYEKLEALISLWNSRADWALTLPRSAHFDLAELIGAAARRKKLATDINRVVQRLESGDVDPKLVTEIIDLLSRHDEQAEDVVASLRDKVQNVGGAPAGPLKDILSPIVKYLNDEYDISLMSITQATAQSVVMAGDEAGTRLRWLDEAGFKGLGKFDPIDPHMALATILGIFGAVVMIMVVYGYLRGTGTLNTPVYVAFSGGITCAVIGGVMVGGLRSLAWRDPPPWGWYLLAAFVAVGLHFIMVLFADVASSRPPEDARRVTHLLLLGSGIPFSIVLAICVLARQPFWRLLRIPGFLWDGVILAATLAIVTVLTVIIAERVDLMDADIPSSAKLERFLRLAALLAVIGFIIGATVIHRVRKAAFSRLVAPLP